MIDSEGNTYGHDYLNSNKMGNTLELTGLTPNEVYEYTVKVGFKDLTTDERTISLSTKPDFGKIEHIQIDDSEGIVLSWWASLKNNQVQTFRISVNGRVYEELTISESSVILTGLDEYKENSITFEALGIDDEVLFSKTLAYGEDIEMNLQFAINELELEVGEKKSVKATLNPDLDLDIIYTSSDEAVLTVDETGNITAVKAGTATVTASLALYPDVKAELEVVVKVISEEDAPKKKGCFGSAASTLGFGFLGLIVAFRRRRYF